MFWVGEEHDDGKDLIAAFRRSWSCDIQSLDIARVDGFDDLSSGLGMLCSNGFDDLCHGIECCVPFRGEKEVEYLPIGVEKGIAVFIDEIAVRGDADCSFLFGEGLWPAGVEAVDGEGRGEGVGRLERGAFGIAFAECTNEAQHLRLKFQKFAAPLPRRDLANLANDGVVLLRKCREQKFARAVRVGPL